jgi:hypothetical protein
MARQDDKPRIPKVGQWVTFWFPEAQGLKALPAQIMGRSRLGGYEVNVSKPGILPRLFTGCPFSDEPKGRCLTWDAPTVDAGFVPLPQEELAPTANEPALAGT